MRSKRVSFAFVVAFGLGWPCSAWGYPDGVTGYSGNPSVNGGKKCSSCHGGGTNPTFSLTGPKTVAPGETQTYVFTITGGPADTAGLDVSTTGGALAAFQSGTKLSSGEITHSAPKSFSGGSASFSFRLKAPSSPGTVTLYGAGISSNGGGPSGDGTGTATMSVTVESAPPVNQPPVAKAGGPYAGTVGQAIQFTSAGSSDPDGSIVSYVWDFGDGSTGTGASPTHAYADAGSFTATLTVTDDQNAQSASQASVTISAVPPQNVPPVANAGGPYAGTVGQAIQFTSAGSSDPDGSIVSYAWDFGDGSTGTGASPTHAYAGAGSFTATLSVTDDQGLSSTDTAQVLVTEGSLLIPLRVAAPGRVRFREGQEKKLKIGAQADLGALDLPPGETCVTLHLLGNGEEVDSVTVCIDISMPSRDDDDDGNDDDNDDDDDDDRTGGVGTSVDFKTALRKGGPTATVRISDSPERGKAAMKGSRLRAVFWPTATAAEAPSLEWSIYVESQGITSERASRTTLVQVKPAPPSR